MSQEGASRAQPGPLETPTQAPSCHPASNINQMCQGPAAGTGSHCSPAPDPGQQWAFQRVSTVQLSGPQFPYLKHGFDTPCISCAGHRGGHTGKPRSLREASMSGRWLWGTGGPPPRSAPPCRGGPGAVSGQAKQGGQRRFLHSSPTLANPPPTALLPSPCLFYQNSGDSGYNRPGASTLPKVREGWEDSTRLQGWPSGLTGSQPSS